MLEKPKMYVIRKYIKAVNVNEAIKLERKTAVHEVYVDDKWQDKNLADAIGFSVRKEKRDSEDI